MWYTGRFWTPTDRCGNKQHCVVNDNIRHCAIVEKVVDEFFQVHNVLLNPGYLNESRFTQLIVLLS